MAYMMLVIGTLMSVAGAYAAIKGYGIVQVEEGWSSVIAGATLFTGGIVTIALGLVLRKLDQLQTGFAGSPASAPSALGPAPAAADPPSGDPKDADDQPMFRSPFGEGSRKSDPTGEPDADRTWEAHGPDDYKLETPSTPEHDLFSAPGSPSRAAAPSRSSADDWLDRAFADFDHDVPGGDPIRKTTSAGAKPAESQASQDPAFKPVFATAEGKDTKTEEISPPSPASDPGSTVIGRYEADGTSYIMYADGSIEAQTRSGVYRFASMAELKAFIES